jgi:cytosine/uracil/thiamine/allantoin permease
METTGRIVGAFLMSVVLAAVTALSLAFLFDFGLSPEQTRAAAVVGAAIIGVLVAVEYFGKKLAKPKCD